MAKQTNTLAPESHPESVDTATAVADPIAPSRSRIETPPDHPFAKGRARKNHGPSGPRVKIERPGLGKKKADGRRSGGSFVLKVLTITKDDDSSSRELCVPANMEPNEYPTIQDDEYIKAEEFEPYLSEEERNLVLAKQADPYYVDPETGMNYPKNLGWGRDGVSIGNKSGGKAFLGAGQMRGVAG